MKKVKSFIAIFLSLILLLSFTACGSIEVSDKFDKEEVRKAGESAVDLVHDGKTAEIYELFNETLKEAITRDELVTALENGLAELGEFKSYSSAVVGSKDQKTDEDYASCVVVASYKNGKKQYSITYNEKLEIVGIYVK